MEYHQWWQHWRNLGWWRWVVVKSSPWHHLIGSGHPWVIVMPHRCYETPASATTRRHHPTTAADPNRREDLVKSPLEHRIDAQPGLIVDVPKGKYDFEYWMVYWLNTLLTSSNIYAYITCAYSCWMLLRNTIPEGELMSKAWGLVW